MGELALGRELSDPAESRLEETDDLDISSVARRARTSLVAGLGALTLRSEGRSAEDGGVERREETHHLVLPGSTIVGVTSVQHSRVPVNLNVDVEAVVGHLHVEVRSSVVLAEVNAFGVTLKDLLDDIGDGRFDLVGLGVVEGNPLVVEREATLDLVGEDGETVGRHVDVVLDVLKHEPRSVAAVVARSLARVLREGGEAVSDGLGEEERGKTNEEVGDKTVLENRREGEDVLASGGVLAGDEEETAKRDEDVASPSASPLRTRREVSYGSHEIERYYSPQQ